MEPKQSRVCSCGCACCNGKRDVIVYTSIFLAFGFLGLYSFAPVPEAMLGMTFTTDEVVDDANAYCTYSDCKQLCDCNGTPCDMDEDIGAFRRFSIYLFVVYLFHSFVMFMGLLGAVLEKATLSHLPAVAVPTCQLLVAIGYLGLHNASGKAILAWHLHNGPEEACTDSFFESANERRTALTVTGWLSWSICACVYARMVYSAKRARDEFANQ